MNDTDPIGYCRHCQGYENACTCKTCRTTDRCIDSAATEARR